MLAVDKVLVGVERKNNGSRLSSARLGSYTAHFHSSKLTVSSILLTMSVRLQYGMRAPHAAGWVIVDHPPRSSPHLRPETYCWIAYQHPDSPSTWFSTSAGSIFTDPDTNVSYHTGLVSAVRDRDLPWKPDYNIYAIPYREAKRLEILESKVSQAHELY